MTTVVPPTPVRASEAYAGLANPNRLGSIFPENTVRGFRGAVNADVRSLALNNPMVANAVSLATAYMNGPTGLRPMPRLNANALGLTDDQAEGLEEEFESIFIDWMSSTASDSDGFETFGLRMDTAIRRAFVTGEMLLSFDWRHTVGSRFGTCCRALDPERITRSMVPGDAPKGHLFRNGIELDENGRLAAIHLDRRIEYPRVDGPFITTGPGIRHPVATKWGRPLLHFGILDRAGPGVWRGISPLAAAILRCLQSDELASLTVKQLAAQAEFAWVIASEMTPDEVKRAFTAGNHGVVTDGGEELLPEVERPMKAMAQWFEVNKLAMSSAVSILPPGSEMKAVTSSITATGYEVLTRRLLTEIARAFGMSYSEFTGDFSQDSYSSAKMSSVGPWVLINRRRASFVAPAYQAAYAAVIEEAIVKGWVKLPSRSAPFYLARDAWTACDFQGPQRPNPDELKVAQANDIELTNGTASLASIAAERGTDWRDILQQRAKEKRYSEKLGLPCQTAAIPVVPADDKEVTT